LLKTRSFNPQKRPEVKIMNTLKVFENQTLQLVKDGLFWNEYHKENTQGLELFFPNIFNLLQSKKVLEIGCCGGSLVKYMRTRGIDARGIDLYGTEEPPILLCGDFMNLSCKIKYDAIFAMGVFEDMAIYRPFAWSKTEPYDRVRRRKFEKFAREAGAKNPKLPIIEGNDLHPPPKCQVTMVRKLRSLIREGGFCVFRTYTSPFLFSEKVVAANGFKFIKAVRRIYQHPYPWETSQRRKLQQRENRYIIIAKPFEK
jgi:hypothetical protein